MCSSIRRQLATASEPNSVQCDRGRLSQSHCSEWNTINSPQNQLAHLTSLPQYQLAPTNSPHLFYQLAPLLLPTRPMLFVNSPSSLTNSPQLLPTRPTSLTNSPPRTSLTNSPHFSDQVGCVYHALTTLINQNKL